MQKQKRIFISHAVKDKPLADALVDLLETGVGISGKDIFCSSLEGMGIPAGSNFIDHIKAQIQEPEIVILLLTRNYYESNFCLCELGATWAMSHNCFPLLVPPLSYEDIKDVLTGLQLAKINSKPDLSDLRDRLIKLLDIEGKSASRWEVKRNKFIEGLGAILKDLPEPSTVSSAEYSKLQSRYNESIREMGKYEDEVSKLKSIIEDLRKCKDLEETAKVLKKFSSETEHFNDLVEGIQTKLSPIPNIAIKALYRHFTDNPGLFFRGLDDRFEIEEANAAKDEGFLWLDGNVYDINTGDPVIKKALIAIKKLRKFLEEEASDEFHELMFNDIDFEISIENVRFWRKYFNVQL